MELRRASETHFNYQDSDNQWHLYQFDLSGYGRPANFHLVFETTLSSDRDYLHIDALSFSSSEEATVIQPGVVTDYTYYVTIQCLDPNGGNISGKGATTTWTAPNRSGGYIIRVIVTDTMGGGASRELKVIVTCGCGDSQE